MNYKEMQGMIGAVILAAVFAVISHFSVEVAVFLITIYLFVLETRLEILRGALNG